jgi:CRISPR/Cas system-associated protein endoribonuclease Cas2
MHPDFCGNKRATSTRGSQVKATLNFAAGPPHLGCYLLDVNVWNQIFDFEIRLKKVMARLINILPTSESIVQLNVTNKNCIANS